jgi:formylglycine-generating enzyme required for sulfatase activity
VSDPLVPGLGADEGSGISAPPESRFDVFLSHSGRDAQVVHRIARALLREGISPWLDAWCLTPGATWQDELDDGLRRSASCAVFVGPNDLGAWERMEVALALDRAAKDRSYRVFPVLLPGLERFDPNVLPPFLRTRTWVDLRKGIDNQDALQALINAVRGVPFGSAPVAALDQTNPPYRGLRAFEERHSHLFFGREAEIQRLLEQLKVARFLAVVGPSGAGKSSLVRAGVLAALQAGRFPSSETWRTSVDRPGGSPLAVLAARLLALGSSAGMQRTVDELGSDRRTVHLAVSLALADRPQEERVALVVDQLEEVFTLCQDELERVAFLDNLVYAATVPNGRTVVITTIRSDFYTRLAAYAEVAQLVQTHQMLVGALGIDRLQEVIEGPAFAAGLDVEAGLTQTIIDDVAGRPGAMPLLEHALLETWNRRRGTMLTLEGYRASGGVQGALRERAEETYGRLSAQERRIARSLLLRLTQPGEGTEDTRRRAQLSELRTSAEDDTVTGVVDDLAAARLLTVGEGPRGEACVEMAHEALIRGWPRLRDWIDEERAALRVHRRLADSAREWQENGRDRSLVYRGRRLAEALAYRKEPEVELNETERAFLAAGTRVRRTTRLVAGVGVVALIAALGWLALPQIRQYEWRREAVSKAPMVSFPAGVASVGAPGNERSRPPGRIAVGAFRLDRYEVRNDAYRLCVKAQRCQRPAEPAKERRFDVAPGRLPVVNVTALQAAAFCRWLGRRLASEAEWERAARGLSGRPWPWGSESPSRVPVNVSRDARPASGVVAVDSASARAGASPEGVTHLVGNVREFTRTPDECRPSQYACPRLWDGRTSIAAIATRGGGWDEPATRVSGADALGVDPVTFLNDATGFRCARSA